MSGEEQQAPTPQTQNNVQSEGDRNPINIKCRPWEGVVVFRIKRNTKLSKLQGAYAAKVGEDVNTIRFIHDDIRIRDQDTPALLDMEDNDIIHVMVEQVGGSPASS